MIELSNYEKKVAGFKVGTRVVYKDRYGDDKGIEAVIVKVVLDPSPRQQSHRYDVKAESQYGTIVWEVTINQLDFSCYDSEVGNELLKEVDLG